MLAGHRLALAFGVVGPSAVTDTDDETARKQLIRAGEAMVGVGLAIVVNRAGTKQPICTLTAVERKHADQEAKDAAAAAGDQNAHKREHRCGIAHAISDPKTATRVLTRLSRRARFNLGIEPRRSRLCIVDLDTARQLAEFALRCGQSRPALTVRSPGQRDRNGNWVHKDGGHIYFDVPEDMELPTSEGIYTDAAGWTAVWGEHQVLVPPSARAEGPYVLVGSAHPMPEWLFDVITSETLAKQERREEARRRRSALGPNAIDDWATATSWAVILTADGWTDTGLIDRCGCPIYLAPGDHASPKSATAHDLGCSIYICDRGHGPLHVWTDYPSEAVADAIADYGTRTLTKIQVLTHTEGEGRMGRMLNELGIEMPGPTVLPPFGTWVTDPEFEKTTQTKDRAATSTDDAGDEDPDEEDADPEDDGSAMFTPEAMFERRVRKEYEYQLVQRAAREMVEAKNAPPLRVFNTTGLRRAPRPKGIA